jgi:subtilisin family serine protease
VLVAFRPSVSAAALRSIESAAGAQGLARLGPAIRTSTPAGHRAPLTPFVLRVASTGVLAAVHRLRSEPGVAYAEPDYLMSASAAPNDPSFALQWGSQNTGQTIPTQNANEELGPPENGTPEADDRALAAWGASTGSRSIVVGETDTGIDYNHQDLAANIWSNPGGIGECAVGTHGYNVLNGSCEPMDDDAVYGGHGTHVAGIIGAVGNNGTGVAGMNWQTSILPVKWLNSEALGSTSGLIAALRWLVAAKQAGVNIRVVNDSATFDGTAYSQALSEEIDTLGQNNILFVTAAGNTGDNNDEERVRRYPCGYDRPTEICVTASNNNDQLPSWANYGAHTVQLAAPGVSIYSTLRGNTYGYLSGGSMASSQVAGAAALILSVKPSLSTSELRADITENVDKLPSLEGKVITGGRLDVCKAMPGCSTGRQPTAETNAASSITRTSATVNGTVNPNGSTVTDCHFEYGPSESYGSSVRCASLPGSGNGVVAVSAVVETLSANTAYHFRIVAANSGGTSHGEDQTFATLAYPPTVTTNAASSIAQTSATLNGAVNPNGAPVTDCHFEYGSSASYGSSLPCASLPGAGETPVGVSASVGSWSANTTYHFRTVATSSAGTEHGSDQMLTTLADAPTVVTDPSSSVTQSSATLNATVDPNGATVEDCHFEYGTSLSYGSSVPCTSLPGPGNSALPVSAPAEGLAAGASYYYRIVATNPGGTGYDAAQAFTTQLATTPFVPVGPGSQPPLPGQGVLAPPENKPPPVANAELASTALLVTSSGTVSVKVICPAGQSSCAGTVTLWRFNAVTVGATGHQPRKRKTAVLTVARGSFRAVRGRVTTVKLHLSPQARTLLARTHMLHVRATIVVRDPNGATHTIQVAVTLRLAAGTRRGGRG